MQRLRASVRIRTATGTRPHTELAGKIAKCNAHLSLPDCLFDMSEGWSMVFLSSPVFRRLILVGMIFAFAEAVVAAEPGEIRWRTDYNSARQEAQEKGLPILLDIGTDDCFYCRKLDSTTFRDPTITAILAGQVLPVRVDGNREAGLVRALNVQVYPTLVLAGPDGKIHTVLQGYQTAEALRPHLKQTITKTTAELVVKAATGNSSATIKGDKTNLTRAKEVLALARDEFRSERYAACLEHCEYLSVVYADQPEGKEAATIVAQIKNDPDRLATATRQINERAANLQLILADVHLKRGNTKDAAACFENVVRLTPNAKVADYAQAQLAQLRRTPGAVPVNVGK
jgi:thioredoxin-related protein